MPVKNVKRKTNDGFEGVITGLNDKEKEIISNSVGMKNAIVDGTFVVEEDGAIVNELALSEEMRDACNNGQLNAISGNIQMQGSQTSFVTSYAGSTEDGNCFFGINVSLGSNKELSVCVAVVPTEKDSPVYANLISFLMIPQLPSDSSSKTYTLRSVNGTLTWVDTSVGTQYFEDINVGGVSLDDKINSAINSAITSTLEANY